MTYVTTVKLANNRSLFERIVAAAATEGIDDPNRWAESHRWEYAVTPGWAAQWESAEAGLTVNDNPDFGVRTNVISDNEILAAVQALITADLPGS